MSKILTGKMQIFFHDQIEFEPEKKLITGALRFWEIFHVQHWMSSIAGIIACYTSCRCMFLCGPAIHIGLRDAL